MTAIRPKRPALLPTSLQHRQKALRTLQARQTQYQSLDCVFEDRLNKEEQHKKTQDRVARNSGVINRKHPILAKAVQDALGKFKTPYQGQPVTTVVRDKPSRPSYSRKTKTLASDIPPKVYKSIKKQGAAAAEKHRHEQALFIKTEKISARINPIVPQSIKKLIPAIKNLQQQRLEQAVQEGNVLAVKKLYSRPFSGLPRSLQKILFNAEKSLKSEGYRNYFELPDRSAEAKIQQVKQSDQLAEEFKNRQHLRAVIRELNRNPYNVRHLLPKEVLALTLSEKQGVNISMKQAKRFLDELLTHHDLNDPYIFQSVRVLTRSGVKVPIKFWHKGDGFFERRLQLLQKVGVLSTDLKVNGQRVKAAKEAIQWALQRPDDAIKLFKDYEANGVLHIPNRAGESPFNVFSGIKYQQMQLPHEVGFIIQTYERDPKNKTLLHQIRKSSTKPLAGPPPPPPSPDSRVSNSGPRKLSAPPPASTIQQREQSEQQPVPNASLQPQVPLQPPATNSLQAHQSLSNTPPLSNPSPPVQRSRMLRNPFIAPIVEGKEENS